jgi:type I restriction enzyme S subunit
MNTIIDKIDLWTTAQELRTSNRGRSASNQSLLGIKKLRELILELAVRGKLLPQDPNDEPASELLKQIAEEKKRLIKDGKIKKQKDTPEIGIVELSFDLPKGWELVRLSDYYDVRDGTHDSPKQKSEGFPLVTSKNLYTGKLDFSDITYISNEDFLRINERSKVDKGDVLFAMIGTIGNPVIVDVDFEFSIKNVALFKYYAKNLSSPDYLQFFLKLASIEMKDQALGGVQSFISLGKLREYIMPLPPLAEQHRIVAKVDELMALCDELENQQTNSNVAHETLVATLLGSLTDAEKLDSFDKSWQRIANHFNILFTTEHSIDQLKQTILQLAVMGKLVTQNPNDEAASELIKKIAKEKARLVKEGKIKKQALLPEITEDERPFGLPAGWEFVRLESLSSLITKGSSPKWQGVSYTENPEDVLFVTSENVGSYQLIFDNKKFVEMKFNEIEPRSVLMKGDYLMNIVGGSIGRTAIYNIDDLANINQAVCLIRIIPNVLDNQYLLHFFNSSICVSYMFDKQVDNARANLSMGNISKFVIPFPPLAEQNRIVSKVEELFALCDGLKERIVKAQTLQNQLAVAVVEQALQ